jgi:hypothetical protein
VAPGHPNQYPAGRPGSGPSSETVDFTVSTYGSSGGLLGVSRWEGTERWTDSASGLAVDAAVLKANYDLAKALEKSHLLEGLKIALENIDLVLDLIRKAESPSDARMSLMKVVSLSEKQATRETLLLGWEMWQDSNWSLAR